MPLKDHFHPPLSERRHWEAFHAAWASEITRTLNRRVLPEGCFAEAHVHLGSQVEIDVATFEEQETGARASDGTGGTVAVKTWAPPATELIMPAVFPDEIGVRVFSSSGGPTLVAAIELISPGNKDRPDMRQAFAVKCASYLQQGIGLIVVDVVTERHPSLHDALIELLGQAETFAFAETTPLYAVAYRPGRRANGDQIEIWRSRLELGQPLPTLPLALRGVATVPVELEATYTTTCADLRI